MAKKLTAFMLAATMLFILLTGCGSTDSDQPSASVAGVSEQSTESTEPLETEASGKLFEEPVTFDMWIIEHASYVYEPGLFLETELSERLNVNFNVTAFQDGYNEKITLGLASGDLPDIFHNAAVSSATDWGTSQGALIDFTQHFDEMPNYTAWAESMGDFTYSYYSGDAMYVMPQYGFGTGSNSNFWIYRRDVFEEHGLEVPTNETEVYEVCKTLKELYPDSYPFGNRNWPYILDRIAYQWGTPVRTIYYNEEQQSWAYGAVEDTFKDCIEWMAMMFEEELIPPNFLSLDNAGWQELVSTGRTFMFIDSQGRIDMFNSPMREDNPDSTLAYMAPFEGGGSGVTTFNPQTQLLLNGFVGFVTSDLKPEMVKYFDWMYTDEAKELMSWGVEGESYVVNADGSRNHIGITPGESSLTEIITTYGFFQRGFWNLVDESAIVSYASKETLEAVEHVLTDAGEYVTTSVTFNEERREKVNILSEPISTHMQENLGLFITGQRPMSEYDAFVEELNNLGLQDYIALHNEQWAETIANRGN